MKPSSWLRLLCIAFAVMCGPLAFAQSTGCGVFDAKVRFADGAEGCMKEFEFFNRPGMVAGQPTKTYSSLANEYPRAYAITITADPQLCPFAQAIGWNLSGSEASKALPVCEDRLRQAVQTLGKAPAAQTCKCEVLVNSGQSNLTRLELLARTKLYERQSTIGNRAIRVVEAAEEQAARVALAEQARKLAEDARKQEEARLAAQRVMDEQVRRQEEARLAKQIDEARKLAEDARRQEEARLALQRIKDEEARLAKQVDEARKLAEDARKQEEARLAAQRIRDEEARKAALALQPKPPAVVAPSIAVAGPSAYTRKVALVIGNADYPGLSRLKNPINDAMAMAKKLREIGFTVIYYQDVKALQIGDIMAEVNSMVVPGSAFVFYYAGHGVQIKGENFFPAVDANIKTQFDIPNQSLQLQRVLDMAAEAKASLNLMMLDACRNNPFLVASRSMPGGLSKIDPPTGTLISFATRPGSVADDGADGANGLYTSFLLKHIDTANLPVESFFKRVSNDVYTVSKGRQEPWVEGNIRGDFTFNQR